MGIVFAGIFGIVSRQDGLRKMAEILLCITPYLKVNRLFIADSTCQAVPQGHLPFWGALAL